MKRRPEQKTRADDERCFPCEIAGALGRPFCIRHEQAAVLREICELLRRSRNPVATLGEREALINEAVAKACAFLATPESGARRGARRRAA